jgi:hypothetical protein
MADEKTRSPARRSISSQISAMGAKLGRALSVEGRDKGPTNERDSMQTSVDDAGEFQMGDCAD